MRRQLALIPLLVLMFIVAVAPVLADRGVESADSHPSKAPDAALIDSDGAPPVDSEEAPVAMYRPTGLDSYRSPSDLLVADIDEALEVFEARLAALTESYHAAAELNQRREIQTQIRALKLGVEVEILEIQLRHALHAGAQDVVDELQARILHAREQNASALETRETRSRIPVEPKTTPSSDASAH